MTEDKSALSLRNYEQEETLKYIYEVLKRALRNGKTSVKFEDDYWQTEVFNLHSEALYYFLNIGKGNPLAIPGIYDRLVYLGYTVKKTVIQKTKLKTVTQKQVIRVQKKFLGLFKKVTEFEADVSFEVPVDVESIEYEVSW